MTAARIGRIMAIAGGYWVVFNLSQEMTAARNAGETLPGILPALGVLTAFFLLSAIAAERIQGAERDGRKNLLWGLAAGGIGIILYRM